LVNVAQYRFGKLLETYLGRLTAVIAAKDASTKYGLRGVYNYGNETSKTMF
jgi:hypothetical protein